jgi:hypothetical protein
VDSQVVRWLTLAEGVFVGERESSMLSSVVESMFNARLDSLHLGSFHGSCLTKKSYETSIVNPQGK